MTKAGNISSLFCSTLNGRIPAAELLLDTKGIIKDKHYSKNIERSVLIASLDSYELAKSHGIDVPSGALGENLLIDYNPYHLTAGSRLKNRQCHLGDKSTLHTLQKPYRGRWQTT